MIRSVHYLHVEIDHLVSAHDSVGDRFFDPFLHRRDVFLRNRTTDDLVLNRHAFATLTRLYIHHDMPVLTTSAGLLDQLPFARGVLGDRFAIGYLRFARVGIDLELAQHAIPDDLQVKLAHPRDNRLTGVFMREDAKRWIFLR